MNISEILSHVDHTQLKAYASWEDIINLCEEAIRFKNSLCLCSALLCRKDPRGL